MSGPAGRPSDGVKPKSNPFEEKWSQQTKRAGSKKQKPGLRKTGPASSGRNFFQDQRFGENKPELSEEDRYLARLQRERSRGTKKRKRYNLSDFLADENPAAEATGTQAPEFPAFAKDAQSKYSLLKDDFDAESLPSGSDGEADEGMIRFPLNADDEPEVKDIDSAGASDDEEAEGGDRNTRTHGEIMSEVMDKSKMFKALRQHTKAADEEKREELDKELPAIMALLSKGDKWKKSDSEGAVKKDGSKFNYESTFQSLAAERRARPSSRLKTEEEKEADERDRLEKLEETRKARMEGISDSEDDDDSDMDAESSSKSAEKAKTKVDKAQHASKVSSQGKPQAAPINEMESVPYFFDECPSTAAELTSWLNSASVSLRGVIVERLLKCFAISLNPSVNGPKLQNLLGLLLSRVVDLSGQVVNLASAAEEVDLLSKHIHTLSSKYPFVAIEWSREQLYESYTKLQCNPASALSDCWNISDVIVLRLLSRLFPGSDVRHSIATPLHLLLSEALSRCQSRNDQAYALGFFVCSVAVELSASSARLSGQVVDFLSRSASTYGLKNEEDEQSNGVTGLVLADCLKVNNKPCPNMRSKIIEAVKKLIVASLYRGRLPSIDLVYGPVLVVLAKNPAEFLATHNQVSKMAQESAKSRKALSLYSEKSIVVPKVLNPKFSAVNGVYRKHNRSRMRGETVEEMRESANRIRKALNKEERGYARDLRKEALLMAQERSEIDSEKNAYAESKSKELQVFLETQQATWKQAAKKQKQMSGKRW